MSETKTAAAHCPVRFTEGAVNEIKNLLNSPQTLGHHALRVGVKGGGCSGFSYILGFEEEQSGDQVFEYAGIRIIMDPSHCMYLQGMEIDYSDGLDNRGFTFNNPNASETCGCGTSFSA